VWAAWQMSERCPGMGLACPFCSKIYHHKSTFMRHYLTHTGEKPISCPHCAYRAARKEHMRKHIANRHGFLSQDQNIYPLIADTVYHTNQDFYLASNNEANVHAENDPK